MGLDRGPAGKIERLAGEILLHGQQLGTQGDRGLERAKRGDDLIADGKRKRQRAVDAFLEVAAGAGLLEENAHGPVDFGERGAFAGVEIVKTLARVVEHAASVERVGVVLGDARIEIEDDARDKRIISGGDAGLKKESAVGAHLVVVGEHGRTPAVEEFVAGAGLGVGEGEPVAVGVEAVVIEPAAGPGLIEFAALGIADEDAAFVAVDPICEAVRAVRVAQGFEDDDGVAQLGVDFFTLARGQMVDHGRHGVHGAGFVAVDAVAHVDDDGHFCEIEAGVFRGVEEGEVIGADPFKVAVVGGRSDKGHDERFELMGAADDLDLHASGRGGGDGAQVSLDLVGA